MPLNDYTFQSTWQLDASPRDVYDVLAELGEYPAWWPEVKEAVKLSEDAYELRCRSFLPYDLRFVTSRSVEDPERMILEANMRGDLEGFSRWTISGAAGRTICVFDEHVITNKGLLDRLAIVARPAFKANHTLMMRHGERGLKTFLAGYRMGRG